MALTKWDPNAPYSPVSKYVVVTSRQSVVAITHPILYMLVIYLYG